MWLNISSLLLPFHLICITFWSSNKFSLFWTVLHIVHKQRAAGTIWPACYEPWSREHTNEDQFSCCQDAILPDATRQINRTTNVLQPQSILLSTLTYHAVQGGITNETSLEWQLDCQKREWGRQGRDSIKNELTKIFLRKKSIHFLRKILRNSHECS